MRQGFSVGIDIAKKDFKACMVYSKESKVKVKASSTFYNTAKGFEKFDSWCRKHSKDCSDINFVLESTGVYGQSLSWFLHLRDYLVHIVLPTRAKSYMKSIGLKSKNDTIDAKGLAIMAHTQQLDNWHPMSKLFYELRALTRYLEQLQAQRTVYLNQKEAIDNSYYDVKIVRKGLESQIKAVDRLILKCKQHIEKTMNKDEQLKERIAHITSIKGVGIITAAVILAETDGFALIRNQKQLTSYAGYDVSENQSGAKAGKSRISKKGNAHIRRAMHLPAFNTVRYELKIFKNLYERVHEKNGIKMKAYVAVQSKLLKLIYTLWKTETDFIDDYQNEFVRELEEKKADSKEPTSLDGLSIEKSKKALLPVEQI